MPFTKGNNKMRNLLLILLCLPMIGFGQVTMIPDPNISGYHNNCGTIINQNQKDYLDQTRIDRQNWSQPKSTIWIPVKHHIIRESNGTGGLDPAQILQVMNELNSYYINSNIQFFECDSINFIDNSIYYDFDSSQESALCSANDLSNVVNIYYFNSATSSSGNSVCGYAYYPPGPDRIIMKNSCAYNGSTIIHEFGHYFSLFHTHGPTNSAITTELVDGSNCTTSGDELCDTPADPNLSGNVTNCLYTGGLFDANGQLYVPDVSNIMSYAPSYCRNSLSSGQYNRINYSATNDRNYLVCGHVFGCVDTLACNYDSLATIDDGSCVYLNTSVLISDVSCNGFADGSVLATTNGGVPPYQYSLNSSVLQSSGTFSNLSPSTYNLNVIDNNGCLYSQNIIITSPTALTYFANVNHISCYDTCDGTINLVAQGGTAPYSYSWNTSPIQNSSQADSLCIGDYDFIITDANGCVVTNSFNINDNNTLPFTNNVSLFGCDSILIGSNYLTSTGTITDVYSGSNGCDSIVNTTFTIEQSTFSYDTLSVTASMVWNGNTLTVSGDYLDTLTNSAGCDSITHLNLTITNTTGILDLTIKKQIVKITNILGQETSYRKNTPLFYIYDDGTVEKKVIFE